MKLSEIIRNLEGLDNSLTICAARTPDWAAESEAELCPSHLRAEECRLPYFLEVSVAKDVLRAWSFARSGAVPAHEQRCRAIIHYAENDAYLLPEHGREGSAAAKFDQFPPPSGKTIVVGWYDGPTSGFLQDADSLAERTFRLVSWNKSRSVRLFAIARLAIGSFARAVAALELYATPRWPVWVVRPDPPVVDRATCATVDRLLSSAGEPTWLIAVDNRSGSIIATADLSASDSKRTADAIEIEESGATDPTAMAYWFALLGIEPQFDM